MTRGPGALFARAIRRDDGLHSAENVEKKKRRKITFASRFCGAFFRRTRRAREKRLAENGSRKAKEGATRQNRIRRRTMESSDQVRIADVLAITGDEGRSSLRKASGSRQTGFDPGISEWGNPPRFCGALPPELNRAAKQTRRTETSQ